jgi:hypothetical protein
LQTGLDTESVICPSRQPGSRRFDAPIALPDGDELATLREAISYLIRTVPRLVHLLKSPANAMRLLRSIKEADEGKLTEREPVEPTRSKTAVAR